MVWPATESMALTVYCALCGTSSFNMSEFRLSTSAFGLYTCKA